MTTFDEVYALSITTPLILGEALNYLDSMRDAPGPDTPMPIFPINHVPVCRSSAEFESHFSIPRIVVVGPDSERAFMDYNGTLICGDKVAAYEMYKANPEHFKDYHTFPVRQAFVMLSSGPRLFLPHLP